ncbi:DUF6284 family protein [Actinoalloteichus caeruleus]|uniref:Uncharacterized protein n=1 Tax=Actinoalloteichus caeruleus DSM 43889 TaxID=1120930 RepID=A0ABT1JE22_ACTCY|nr:DUF6284 family protein [Actinoalloteichus caeruleus]MCP2330745.1 hypothetical protein [Actinoalloteichus caeruleus DSM 43889]
MHDTYELEEPADRDLAAIELEGPLIDAGVAVVDAECAVLLTGGGDLAVQRLSRARRQEAAERVRYARRRSIAHTTPATRRLGQVIPLHRVRVLGAAVDAAA